MASFLKLQRTASKEIAEAYHKAALVAEERRAAETHAATLIQAAFRGFVWRKKKRSLDFAAGVIQRCFHCFQATRVAERRRKERDARLAHEHYMRSAVAVQRVVRGFLSRKYVHDARKRRAYLEMVRENGEKFREELYAAHRAQVAETRARQAEDERAEFRDLTRGLHHLLSTKANAGIYAPPSGLPPVAYGEPLEDHLRRVKPSPRATKDRQIREAERAKEAEREARASRLPTVQGPFLPPVELERRTERRAAKYAANIRDLYLTPYERTQSEDRIARLLSVDSKRGFVSTVAPDLPLPPPQSVHVNIPYTPPLPVVPRHTDRTKLATLKPFKSALPQDKDFGELDF